MKKPKKLIDGVFSLGFLMLCVGANLGQENSRLGNAARTVFDGHIVTVHLAPHFTTTIRLPEPVSSVILGDSALFQAEHSPNEPLLVFIKPLTTSGETNALISTIAGRQFSLLLKNGTGPGQTSGFPDLLIVCRSAGSSFIEETFPSSLIAESLELAEPNPTAEKPESTSTDWLVPQLEQQRKKDVPKLHGNRLQAVVSEVLQHDSRYVALFSVVNTSSFPVDLLAPQVQLAGRVKSGIFGRNKRWTTVDQIRVLDFHLDKRKLEKGGRTDGYVIFEPPTLKQSNESLLLQIADSARIDQPVLVPINFSVSEQMEKKP